MKEIKQNNRLFIVDEEYCNVVAYLPIGAGYGFINSCPGIFPEDCAQILQNLLLKASFDKKD